MGRNPVSTLNERYLWKNGPRWKTRASWPQREKSGELLFKRGGRKEQCKSLHPSLTKQLQAQREVPSGTTRGFSTFSARQTPRGCTASKIYHNWVWRRRKEHLDLKTSFAANVRPLYDSTHWKSHLNPDDFFISILSLNPSINLSVTIWVEELMRSAGVMWPLPTPDRPIQIRCATLGGGGVSTVTRKIPLTLRLSPPPPFWVYL